MDAKGNPPNMLSAVDEMLPNLAHSEIPASASRGARMKRVR